MYVEGSVVSNVWSNNGFFFLFLFIFLYIFMPNNPELTLAIHFGLCNIIIYFL